MSNDFETNDRNNNQTEKILFPMNISEEAFLTGIGVVCDRSTDIAGGGLTAQCFPGIAHKRHHHSFLNDFR